MGGGDRRAIRRAADGLGRRRLYRVQPDYPTRIDGKVMATRMSEITPYEKSVFADMQNARVQVYGDTAILTYNYAGITRGADGKSEPQTAKSTRVYVKSGGQWKLVHGNFAPVQGPQN